MMNIQKAEFEVLGEIAKLRRLRRAIRKLAALGGDSASIAVLMRYNTADLRTEIGTLRVLRHNPKNRRRFLGLLQFPAKPLDCECGGLCYGHFVAEVQPGRAVDVEKYLAKAGGSR